MSPEKKADLIVTLRLIIGGMMVGCGLTLMALQRFGVI